MQITSEFIANDNSSIATQIKESILFDFNHSIKSGVYGYTIITMTYNSNKIEGSRLSEEETANLFETGTVFSVNGSIYVPHDVEETRGHFIMFNNMLRSLEEPLTEKLIKSFHYDLKYGVFEDIANGYNIGEYKSRNNRVGTITTATANETPIVMKKLLDSYNPSSLEDLLRFHVQYETIHPFQDGNGRTGRLILFRECLRLNYVPIIIYDNVKADYIMAMNVFRTTGDISKFLELATTLQKQYIDNVKNFLS